MDSKELRGLVEAYTGVYAPQENIEEGLRSAVKRLLGGGKKEAEAPKPESRGEQLRKKYNVGPEKSDTSAKRQILNRSRARAERDQERYGDKPFQKQVAQQSKAAHDRYLKAGYSKYGADLKHGRGNKAAKRAATLNREEFEFIVNALIEEGYDLSSYTYDEMYDICLDEAVKGADPEMRKAASAERRGGDKRLSPSTGKGYADQQKQQIAYMDKVTKKNKNVVGLVTKEELDIFDAILEYLVAEGYAATNKEALVIMANMSEEWRSEIDEGMTMKDFQANRKKAQRSAASADAKKRGHVDRFTGKPYGTEEAASRRKDIHTPEKKPSRDAARDAARGETGHGGPLRTKKVRKAKAMGELGEGVDLFDYLLEYLVAEGYADTNKAAIAIMSNMSEEWKESIIESQYARENPEKYEREQAKKTSKKEKAMNDPHTGINSPAFEKFMRQQMGR